MRYKLRVQPRSSFRTHNFIIESYRVDTFSNPRGIIFLDLQDYTYYFVPAPWLSCKLLRLLQLFPPPSEQARLIDCLETILNKVQEAPKSKKIQHSNAKNAVLLEAINLIIHLDRKLAKTRFGAVL